MEVRCQPRDVARYKSNIINAISEHQVVIILGDTGSGKTTQIPQYLLEAEINGSLNILATQPWRVGAILAARKVAQERYTSLGQEVGFEVIGVNQSDKSTKIKYVTEDVLLNYCVKDDMLLEYGVIMIDEAHVRSAENCILLSILKETIKKRKNLKVVIVSARMGDKLLSTFFDNVPIISIESRRFKISTIYELPSGNNYIEHSVKVIRRICNAQTPGDILLFLADEEEVKKCCQILITIECIHVIPMYSSLRDMLPQCFTTTLEGCPRKVIVATNIAESVVTTDNIRFIIDCGSVTESVFHKKQNLNVMTKFDVSKAQADQRKRVVGRRDKGFCYRLYAKSKFELFMEEPIPNIKTKDLCSFALKIIAIGYNPLTLRYIDSLDIGNLKVCMKELIELKLINSWTNVDDFIKKLSSLPLELTIVMTIFYAQGTQWLDDIIAIASMMTVGNVFIYSKEEADAVESCHKAFHDQDGDPFTNLNVFDNFLDHDKSKEWCNMNSMDFDLLVEAEQIRNNIKEVLQINSIPPKESLSAIKHRSGIKLALAKAFHKHSSTRDSEETYFRIIQEDKVYIHPSSSLFNEDPEIVAYWKIILTQKPHMFGILRMDMNIWRQIYMDLYYVRELNLSFLWDFFMGDSDDSDDAFGLDTYSHWQNIYYSGDSDDSNDSDDSDYD